MKKLKIWSILMLAFVMMPLVASCGGDDDDNGGGSNSVLVGEWQECKSNGELKNDATDYEVMHLRLRSDGTGDWWSVIRAKNRKWFFRCFLFSKFIYCKRRMG